MEEISMGEEEPPEFTGRIAAFSKGGFIAALFSSWSFERMGSISRFPSLAVTQPVWAGRIQTGATHYTS